MSTIRELKDAVIDYLQVESPAIVDETLDIGGSEAEKLLKVEALVVRAANNAVKRIQMKHDFDAVNTTLRGTVPSSGRGLPFDNLYEELMMTAVLTGADSVTASMTFDFDRVEFKDTLIKDKENYVAVEGYGDSNLGPLWGTITSRTANSIVADFSQPIASLNNPYTVNFRGHTQGSQEFVEVYRKLKTVHNAWIVDNDGNDIPLRFETKRRTADRLLEHQERRVSDTGYWEFATLIAVGQRFFLYPANDEDFDVRIDCSIWNPEYTDDEDSDFFLEHGFEYMMWACVVEVNRLIQAFVPRSEGSLPPPIRERDEAAQALIEFDIYQQTVSSEEIN